MNPSDYRRDFAAYHTALAHERYRHHAGLSPRVDIEAIEERYADLRTREAIAGLVRALEATPAHVDPEELRRHLVEVPGVVDVHDLHVWTITSGLHSLSVHVAVDDLTLEREGVGPLLDRFSACVSSHFEIEHTTFQIEPVAHREHEELGEPHP